MFRSFKGFIHFDVLIIASYLLLMLGYCVYYAFNRVRTISEYAIANKKCSTVGLIATVVATSIGAGSIVGDVAKIADDGVIFLLSLSGILIFYLYMAFYIAPKFDERFSDMISAGDIMRHFYGATIEKISAIIGVLFGILASGAQLTGLGYIFQKYTGFDYSSAILIIGIITTTYSAFGGMKSIMHTDAVQLLIIAIALPSLGFAIFNEMENSQDQVNLIKESKFLIFWHPKFFEYMMMFCASMLPTLWLYPAVLQRFLMAKNSAQIKIANLSQFIARILIMCIVAYIGISCVMLFPDIKSENLMSHVIQEVLDSHIKGLFLIGIFSASMSTIDSHLNSSVVLLMRNLLSYYFDFNERRKILFLRYSSIFIGGAGIAIAGLRFNVVNLMVTTFSFWGSVIVMPMLCCIFRLESSAKVFWLSLLSFLMMLVIFALSNFQFGLLFPSISAITSFLVVICYYAYRRLRNIY